MTSERERVEYELRVVVEMLIKLAAIWDTDDPEQRQSLIQILLTHVIYDLDTRRIVNFKLKPWVERFVELRLETEKTEKGAQIAPLFLNPTSHPSLGILKRLYARPAEPQPTIRRSPKKPTQPSEQNLQIFARYQAGETLTQLAMAYGVSYQRIHQIVRSQLNAQQ